MDKKIQDLAWACLPKEDREALKRAYKYQCQNGDYNRGFNEALEEVFNSHNLTSDTEPEEMLIAKASEVKALCRNSQLFKEYKETEPTGELIESWLIKLFGDKCLPDKEHNEDNFAKSESSVQGEPKFKVGDIVRVKCPPCKGEIGIIDEIGSRIIEYHLQGSKALENFWFAESDLEPYTESESRNLSQETANCDKPETNNQNDNMEKELNLCELLKGCEFGEMKVRFASVPIVTGAASPNCQSSRAILTATILLLGWISFCFMTSLLLITRRAI